MRPSVAKHTEHPAKHAHDSHGGRICGLGFDCAPLGSTKRVGLPRAPCGPNPISTLCRSRSARRQSSRSEATLQVAGRASRRRSPAKPPDRRRPARPARGDRCETACPLSHRCGSLKYSAWRPERAEPFAPPMIRVVERRASGSIPSGCCAGKPHFPGPF